MFIKDDQYASYKLLSEGFFKLRYTLDEEIVEDARYVSFTSPRGRTWKTRAAHISYPQTNDFARNVSIHKELAYEFAHSHGVTIPFTRLIAQDEVVDVDEVDLLFKRFGNLIVKPSNSSLSRGLTLNIRTHDQLNKAIEFARTYAESVLIQQQIDGEEVRFVVINDKVQAALLRRTARVIGDGNSSIKELIQKENKERESLVFPYISYPQLDASIVDGALLNSEQVPAKNEVVELNRATMIKNGCSIYNIFSEVDKSYIETVEHLARDLGAGFVVVDIFIQDYTQPQTSDNYCFIEFNVSPVLKLFYGCRDGKMFDIVGPLTRAIDVELNSYKPNPHTKDLTLGSFEQVCLPDFTNNEVVAKIDTGAYTGAFHATNIVRVTVDGKDSVSFNPLGEKKLRVTVTDFKERLVRSAHGHSLRRYIVPVRLKIKGRVYETKLGLSDRKDMQFRILIGRKFLRDNGMMVDVSLNEEHDYEKGTLE